MAGLIPFKPLVGFGIFFVAMFVVVVSGNLSEEPRIPMEFQHPVAIPEGWKKLRAVPVPDRKVSFLIALKVRNTDELERITLSVSDPKSSEYGHHLSISEISDLISPPKEDVLAVREWLISNGISEDHITVLPRGDWIRFQATIPVVERLLDCSFNVYKHLNSETTVVRTRSYSLPLSMSKLISFVGGTVRFPKIKSKNSASQLAKHRLVSDVNVTPSFIKTHYNITDEGVSSSNLQSVNQFLEQYYSPSDLSEFFNKFNLPANTVAKVVGPNKPGNPGDEASLDIEYIMGVATNVPTWFVYTAGNDNGNQEPFLEWITALVNTQGAPWVNSVSYGDVEASISADYLSRMDVEFQAAGSMGLSILYASGDDGAGCKRCNDFVPDWPASSPWVTTVGGTQMSGNNEVGVGFSGGGFSNYFSRPSYQETAVADYLSNNNLPNSKFYNSTSRGYPDIAAFATNFEIIIGGGLEPVDGTSCAAPTASAIFSLLNDIRLQNGKSALGFLNPLLYSITDPDAIRDITDGNNGSGCCPGFSASKGWDPVTGLGSINYGFFKELVLNLQ